MHTSVSTFSRVLHIKIGCVPRYSLFCRSFNNNSKNTRTTFVSSHYEFNPDTIKHYLHRKNFSFKLNPASDEINVKDCPFCHDTKNKPDNVWKLFINSVSGTFFCHRCDAKGSWFDFQKRMGDILPLTNSQNKDANSIISGSTSGVKPPRGSEHPLGGVLTTTTKPSPKIPTSQPSVSPVNVDSTIPATFPEQWKLQKTIDNLDKYPKVRQYLCGTGKEERHLKPEVLAAYKVGAGIFRFRENDSQKWIDHECVTFPWLKSKYVPESEIPTQKSELESDEESVDEINLSSDTTTNQQKPPVAQQQKPPVTQQQQKPPVALQQKPPAAQQPPVTQQQQKPTAVQQPPVTQQPKKTISIPDNSELILLRMKYRPIAVKDFRIDPPGGQWGLFGWHLVENSGSEEIILTEGEIDAMSVYQATGRVAVSLPNGASSLPVEIVEMLEPFKRIYLWMDDDVKGIEGAEKFANKLGKSRCLIIRTNTKNIKDANDAIRAKLDLSKMLKNAAPLPHKQILQFSELRDQIFTELTNPNQVSGVMCRTFPTLNLVLKGHRKAELTIVTGHTGIGKTTILCQLSIDYCQQGVNTLWGSFELDNVKLVKKMLTQFTGKNLEENINEFNYYADKFSELPLYFMRFYGSTGIDEVLDAMEYAAYVLDVEHVILDNLQFMTGTQARGYEKFDLMDYAIERIRKFTTERRVHVTIVIHPKKTDDGTPLTMSSVFGTAKATQEADNVVIVQNGQQWRYLEVCKNRFDGTLGQIPYRFQPDNLKYYELTNLEKMERETEAKKSANTTRPTGFVNRYHKK